MYKFHRVNRKILILLASIFYIFSHIVVAGSMDFSEEDLTAILVKADSYRLQEQNALVVTSVAVFDHGELKDRNTYHVYTRPPRKSLVVFKGQGDEGKKLLMLQDNYWMLMPGSRRPIRITPMQKLLGGASVGDVSTLTWSEDYRSKFIGEEVSQAGKAICLALEAKTPGASYQKVILWLDYFSYFPLKAELYLKSGKLVKTAHFTEGVNNGVAYVKEMLLVDAINKNKKTRVHYENMTPHNLPEKYYNPVYLSRQKAILL